MVLKSANWASAAVLVVGAASIAAPSARAQQGTGASQPGGIEEITVTARKREESILDVPDAMTAFSAQKISEAGIRTMRDFTNLTPNIVFTQNGPGYPTIVVRGISQAQGGEPPVALVIDDVQMAHAAFFNQDYGDVERIEVLRGPQGSLYGRNAIGGAINIVTRQPTNEFEGSVRGSYANAETVATTAGLSGPIIADKVLFSVGGSYRNSDGDIEDQFQNEPVDDRDDKFYRGRLLFNLTDSLQLDLRANYGDNDDGSLGNELVTRDQFDDFEPGFLAQNAPLREERELWDYSAKLRYEFNGYTLTSITGYSKVEDHIHGDADFSPQPIALQDVQLDVDAWTQEIRLASPSDGRFTWLIGAFYQDRDTDNFLQIPLDDGTGHPSPVVVQQSNEEGNSKSSAVFGSVSFDIGWDTELTLGGRYDRDERESADRLVPASADDETFSEFQPKVQLMKSLSDSVNVYATYGRGFRSGGFNAFASTGVDRVYDKEVADNYEIGVKGRTESGLLGYSAAAFLIEYENQQFFFVGLNPPSQNVLNIDKTRITGLEFELTSSPVDGLQLSAGLGIADGEIRTFDDQPGTEGNDSPKNSPYTANLSAQYTMHAFGDFDLRTYVSYRRQDKKYWDAANTLKTPAKDFVDARMFLDNGTFAVGAYAINAFDERYPTEGIADVAGPDVNLRLPSTAREYGVEANYRF